MKSLFRRLFGGRAPQRAVRTRRLMLETCESRQLLCDDLTTLPTAPPSEPTSPPAAVVLPPTAPAPEATPPQSPPAALFGPNQPPVLVELTARQVIAVQGGFLWEISGKVTDDHLAEGVTVYFSGLLQGKSTPADTLTGGFVTTAILPQGTTGIVVAAALDSQFAASAAKTVLIQ